MTVTQVEIETLRQVQNEIIKRALRLEEVLYNDTAMQILLSSTGDRYDRLHKKRGEVKVIAKTMMEISNLITKKIKKLQNH